jgi:hypothetical protein
MTAFSLLKRLDAARWDPSHTTWRDVWRRRCEWQSDPAI